MDDLDDFLTGPQAEVTDTPNETVEPEATQEQEIAPVRDEKGRFAPKGEQETAPAAPPAAEEMHQTAPVKALQEERRKRQLAEDEREQLRQEIATFRQQHQQQAPDLFEDPQGWQQSFGQDVVGTAVQQATLNARLDMSEMMVRQSQPDFEDKKAVFVELMAQTPGLQQKALADPHPWNFAYNYVKNHERMQELAATNVSDLEAKLREKVRAELEAELAAKQPAPSIPTSLADAQSARSATVAGAPPTLDDILGRKA